MIKRLLAASLSTIVVLVPSVGVAKAEPKTKDTSLQLTPNTITKEETVAILKHAYLTSTDARKCIDYGTQNFNELALGFCYSWYVQALDDKEITIARDSVAMVSKRIRDGIASERD